MKTCRFMRLGVVACLLACRVALGQATVTINEAVEHQTIEGFGAHGSMDVWWSGGPFYNAGFLDLMVDDLGMTMNRNEFYPTFEPSNENGDPDNLDMSRFNYGSHFGTKQKNWLIALKNRAAQSGEPMRFITSYWSPPAWMKTNNSTTHGGSLRAGVEDEFAEFCIATVRAYKEQCNIDVYAHSIQNEPAFEEYYNSCVYTADHYRDVIKVVGPKLHAAYPEVKLFGAEDMLANWTRPGAFPGRLMADPASRAQMWALAVHGYNDGANPTPVSQAVSLWKGASRNCTSVGKPLWMTETSGYQNNWPDAMQLAEMIYASLKYGKISAWVYWQLGVGGAFNGYQLMYAQGRTTDLYYVSKHYYRYIRPEAVAIDGISDDELVFSLAFRHKQNRTLTVILLNSAGGTRTVSLVGNGLPTFTVYRSSDSQNCVNVGSATNSVTLPNQTVTTLYGTNYDPVVPVIDPATGRASPAGLAGCGDVRIYSLAGRLVASGTDLRLRNGHIDVQHLADGGLRLSTGLYKAATTDLAGTTRVHTLNVK